MVGLLLIGTIPLVLYLVATDGGKKNILQARSGGDLIFIFIKLDLRDDGSFKLSNSGPFGGKFYCRHYTLQNDTLRIDNGDKNLYPGCAFVVRFDSVKQKRYFDPLPSDATKESAYELYIQSENSNR